jgi:hypothetical protein
MHQLIYGLLVASDALHTLTFWPLEFSHNNNCPRWFQLERIKCSIVIAGIPLSVPCCGRKTDAPSLASLPPFTYLLRHRYVTGYSKCCASYQIKGRYQWYITDETDRIIHLIWWQCLWHPRLVSFKQVQIRKDKITASRTCSSATYWGTYTICSYLYTLRMVTKNRWNIG